jgi:hypothetical protein|tara:strand:- start:756 stop:1037 length:282 start_codon:yes stop_codon:yes gene_type:complete
MSVSTTFTVAVGGSGPNDALQRIVKHLPVGFAPTGNYSVRRSSAHSDYGTFNIEVANHGGDQNDCWFMLTSYGMNPSDGLGSVWQSVEGVGKI